MSSSFPALPQTLSLWGEDIRKGRSRKRGRGNKNSKPTTKTRIKKEERKKKNDNQKARRSWGRFNKKRKNKKLPLGKKENKKKILCIISKFCDFKILGPDLKFFQIL